VMPRRMLCDRRGYSMTFWAVFIGLVMVPLMALSLEVGRYFFARSQIAAAADAASLSAAIEINRRVFIETGQVVLPTSETYAWAQQAVNANCGYLIERGIHPHVGAIIVSGNTVQVSVSADLSLLFPSIVPDISVFEIGKAEVRALKR
jgi:uncharacterized membrane protein